MACKCAPACKKALDDASKRWPKRKKASDGCCGDAAHAARKSDHNPNAAGYALAYDITHDPVTGPDCEDLSLDVIHDPRITYVIWNSRIYKARTKQWEAYRGPNKHTKHMHVSIKTKATKDLSPWPWSAEAVADKPKSIDVPDVPVKEDKVEVRKDPPVETVGTKPPVVEVNPSKVSMTTKIGSTLAPVGTFLTAVGFKIGGVSVTNGVIITFLVVFAVSLVVAAWIYNEGQKRAFERQKLSMNNMADPNRANVVAGK